MTPRISKITAALALAATLAACAHPVVYDLEEDKVWIQASSEDAATMHTADEACGIHGKKAVGPLSHRCLNGNNFGFCHLKAYLFACKAAPSRTQQAFQGVYLSHDAPLVRSFTPTR